eukprot:1252760-Rhodomonas_salina.1
MWFLVSDFGLCWYHATRSIRLSRSYRSVLSARWNTVCFDGTQCARQDVSGTNDARSPLRAWYAVLMRVAVAQAKSVLSKMFRHSVPSTDATHSVLRAEYY